MDQHTAVAMVETNARSMTDTFLRASWRNAFDMALTAPDRETWRAIRDTYARELDRRAADCAYSAWSCTNRACLRHPDSLYGR